MGNNIIYMLMLMLSHFSLVRPHRRQPTRLPHPWDSPGKNTGVGCHCLLQCMKVKSESEVAQSCPTLSDLMDCSLRGSSVHGIFQTRVLEWGAIAFMVLIFSSFIFSFSESTHSQSSLAYSSSHPPSVRLLHTYICNTLDFLSHYIFHFGILQPPK